MGPWRKMCIFPYGTKTTKAVIEGLRCYFQDFYLPFLFKIKPWKCLLINHINNFVSLGVDWWIVVYFFLQHHEFSRIRKFVITGCGCTLVVKCHNKGSCIQAPVEKLSWLHSNFMAKQRILMCDNGQSQFSFLCRYIWEIII